MPTPLPPCGRSRAPQPVRAGLPPIPEGRFLMTVTLYHNPNCSVSRAVLALIRGAGIEPTVVEYLKTPPPRDEIRALAQSTGLGVRGLLRQKDKAYAEANLDRPGLSDDALLDAIEACPALLNRPILVTPLGTRLARPPEVALDIPTPSPVHPGPDGRDPAPPGAGLVARADGAPKG